MIIYRVKHNWGSKTVHLYGSFMSIDFKPPQPIDCYCKWWKRLWFLFIGR